MLNLLFVIPVSCLSFVVEDVFAIVALGHDYIFVLCQINTNLLLLSYLRHLLLRFLIKLHCHTHCTSLFTNQSHIQIVILKNLIFLALSLDHHSSRVMLLDEKRSGVWGRWVSEARINFYLFWVFETDGERSKFIFERNFGVFGNTFDQLDVGFWWNFNVICISRELR